MLFIWNSVLGGTDILVLCVHTGGDAHVEQINKDSQSDHYCTDTASCVADCTSCTDVVLKPAYLEPMRPLEPALANLPVLPSVSVSENLFRPELLRTTAQALIAYPYKDSPGVESLCRLICRITVLRL